MGNVIPFREQPFGDDWTALVDAADVRTEVIPRPILAPGWETVGLGEVHGPDPEAPHVVEYVRTRHDSRITTWWCVATFAIGMALQAGLDRWL